LQPTKKKRGIFPSPFLDRKEESGKKKRKKSTQTWERKDTPGGPFRHVKKRKINGEESGTPPREFNMQSSFTIKEKNKRERTYPQKAVPREKKHECHQLEIKEGSKEKLTD